MATNVRLSTEELIKDVNGKLKTGYYNDKPGEKSKVLADVKGRITSYEKEVKRLTGEGLSREKKEKADKFLKSYEKMLNDLEEINKRLSPPVEEVEEVEEVVVVANTSTSATSAANALSKLTLGGAPSSSAAAGGAASFGPAAAAAPALQEIHVCPEGVGELFRLGGDELKQGDCFYSSLYKAALHHSEKGLVNRIYELFDGQYASAAPAAKAASAPAAKAAPAAKPIPEERTFIMALRTKTAQLMRTGVFDEIKQRRIRNVNADPSIGRNRATEAEKEALRQQQRDLVFTLFDYLWDNSEGENKIMYTAWLEEAPTQIQNFFNNTHRGKTFRNIYPEQNPENEKRFYNDMATFIQTWKVYASETDISVVKHHLLKGGVALEAVSAIDTKKCMYFGRMPVLWLFKQAYRNERGELISGNHFGYFRKDNCSTLHDPCSGEPINLDHLSYPRNPVKYLEEKIKIIAAARAAEAARLEAAAPKEGAPAKPPGKSRKTRKNRRY